MSWHNEDETEANERRTEGAKKNIETGKAK